ncbi:hypothetical protein D3C80_1549300 [compost metagenome]
MAHFAYRRQHERELIAELIDRRSPFTGKELRFATGPREFPAFVQIRGTRMIQRWARPLNVSQVRHLLVGSAVIDRTQLTQFVPDFLRVVVVHRVTHGRRHQADDLPVRLHIAHRFHCFIEALEAAVCRGIHPFMLAP